MGIANTNNPVERLVPLYEDGAFNRRELVRRIAAYTRSIATATAARGAFVPPAEGQACPDGVPGGRVWYPDSADALAAYNSLNSQGHFEDMQSAVEFLGRSSFVDSSHLGAAGFWAQPRHDQ